MRESGSAGIPLLPGPLIGRRGDLAQARDALLTDGARLLTVTGPPGVGKTTLALALAHDLADRFGERPRLVDLAPITDPDDVVRAIAERLQAPPAGERPIDRLFGLLGKAERLLVLDNFEQVIEAAPLVAELLGVCPGLRIVVTSRVPLRLRWERELALDPLELPSRSRLSPAELASVESVELFVARARAVRRGFDLSADNAGAVAAICASLDGLPLAIELAAARARTLPLETILRSLAADRQARATALDLLAEGPRDVPARQQTLRNAIRWSYALLTPEEQAVFRRLAVFVGGCTFEAAEAVCEASWGAINSLIEKGLVRGEWDDPDEPRVRMLETLRHYALEQLSASGDVEDVQARHATYFVGLAEQAESELRGPSQQRWLARLDRERHNLAAVERRATASGDAETVARLGAALWRFWWARADAAEAHERVNAILTLARQAVPSATLALALHAAGSLAALIGEHPTSRSLLEAGEAVARGLEDRRPLARVLTSLGRLAFVEGHYPESRRLLEESLAILRDVDDRAGLILPLNYRGFVEYLEGDQSTARTYFGEALALAREAADQAEIGHILHNFALTYHVEGDVARAEPFYRQSVAVMRESHQGQLLTMALGNFGHALTLGGDRREARTLLHEALSLARTMGNRRRLAFTLWSVAALAASEGRADLAVRFEAATCVALDALGAVLARPMRELLLAQVAAARQTLSGPGVAAAELVGRTTTLDRAVDEALVWLGEPPPATAPARSGMATLERPGSPPAPPTTNGARGTDGPRSRVSVLTPREREVAALLGRGFSNRQIAEALVISLRTAENHVAHICDKLELDSRTQVTAWAVEQGLHRQ